jgi:hypothetical protein
MTDRALIQTLQMQLGAQQQQAGGQQSEMTAMAVQHALEAQQAQAYVAMIEQQNQQQQAALIASQQMQQQLEHAMYQQQLAMQHQLAGNNPSGAVAARPPNWPPAAGSDATGQSGAPAFFNPASQPPMPWQQPPGAGQPGQQQAQQAQQSQQRPPPPPSWQGSTGSEHPPQWKGPPPELNGTAPQYSHNIPPDSAPVTAPVRFISLLFPSFLLCCRYYLPVDGSADSACV